MASKNLVPKIRVPFGTVSRHTTWNVPLLNSPSISFALDSTNYFGLSFNTIVMYESSFSLSTNNPLKAFLFASFRVTDPRYFALLFRSTSSIEDVVVLQPSSLRELVLKGLSNGSQQMSEIFFCLEGVVL